MDGSHAVHLAMCPGVSTCSGVPPATMRPASIVLRAGCPAATRCRASAQISSSAAVSRSRGRLCGGRPMATISATVKSSSAGLSWATTAVRLAASRCESRTTSSPSTVISPADGRSAR
ncbi:hypothetical protein ACIBKY_44580 [Nonomuraea sp. NPDC050394]|uniref:hypothetical protein n=1 Tax=Nonomuraea sp. NPDC050394 TaxID=3364363 RepID=UPI0037BC81CB